MPSELSEQGVVFHTLERGDVKRIGRVLGAGADLVVDLLAFSAAEIEARLPLWTDAESVVVASSRAVYIDAEARHINGQHPPQFAVPIPESNPTLAPAAPGTDPFTREGYGPSKVAVERAALESGLPVTVIRPSKVHGRWARNARTRTIAEQMLRGADSISLASRGAAVDHLSAAENIASLIHTAAQKPGARILNAADPDPLTAAQIVETIAETLDWDGELRLLEPGAPGGDHPWNAAHPIILETSAATDLGWLPVTSGRELLRDEVRWVAAHTARAASPG